MRGKYLNLMFDETGSKQQFPASPLFVGMFDIIFALIRTLKNWENYSRPPCGGSMQSNCHAASSIHLTSLCIRLKGNVDEIHSN